MTRIASGILLFSLSISAYGVTPESVDDFENLTTQGWSEGAGQGGPNPNPPTVNADGGPMGTGDAYLDNVSSGGSGAGSRQVIFNTGAAWTGDFGTADITQVSVDIRVDAASEDPASIRFGMEGTNGDRFVSTNAVDVPNDGNWYRIVLPVADSTMTRVSGTGTLAQTMASMAESRLIHGPSNPAWQAQPFDGTVGYDNISPKSVTQFSGWLWEPQTQHVSIINRLEEEICFGPLALDIDSNDEWRVLGHDTCYGRTTTNNDPALEVFNYDTFTGMFVESEMFEARSSEPLVSAGGNLLELVGFDIEEGLAGSSNRLATVLAEPSDSDLLIVGGYNQFVDSNATAAAGFVDLLVKDSPDTRANRVASDLEGLWYTTFFTPQVSLTNAEYKSTSMGVRVLDLQAGGACAFLLPTVLPDAGFVDNGDFYLAEQTSFNDNLTNRVAAGYIYPEPLTGCSYQIDSEGYLQIDFLADGIATDARFTVSDDDNYFIPATNPPGGENEPITLTVGYRAPTALASNAIDGDYLFYLNINDYNGTGTENTVGDTGTQAYEMLGRGVITFDSTTVGTVPAGQTGTWNTCSVELVAGQAEHGVDGSQVGGTVFTFMNVDQESLVFPGCDFRLDTDGGLLMNLTLDPTEQVLFGGYVNHNGEVVSLVDADTEIENPGATISGQVDTASVRHILAMQYTGNLSGNDDGDPFSNLEEFQLPLPASAALDTTGMDDTSGDMVPDFATFVGEPGQQPRARVMSGADGSVLGTLNFLNPAWNGVAIDTVEDANGDGTGNDPGVAMLLIDPATNRLLVQVRDAASGANINKINFLSADWEPVDVVVFNDVNGDGNPSDAAVGVLAVNRVTGKILVQVRDLDSGAKIATRSFLNANWRPIGAASADRAGLPPALGILAVEDGTAKILVQTRQLTDGALIDNAKYLSGDWEAKDIARVVDGNSDGTANDPAWLVLASNRNTGSHLVQARDIASGARQANIGYLTDSYEVSAIGASPDISGNSREEAGVLAIRSDNDQIILQVRDYADGTRTGNVFPP